MTDRAEIIALLDGAIEDYNTAAQGPPREHGAMADALLSNRMWGGAHRPVVVGTEDNEARAGRAPIKGQLRADWGAGHIFDNPNAGNHAVSDTVQVGDDKWAVAIVDGLRHSDGGVGDVYGVALVRNDGNGWRIQYAHLERGRYQDSV